MSVTAILGPELPFLRRYARALTGSQRLGDAAVRDVLTQLLTAPETLDVGMSPRFELYRVFHLLWRDDLSDNNSDGLIANLHPTARKALLLTAVEGFTLDETALILSSNASDVADQIAVAREAISHSLEVKVLIIEDEAIIALHIQSIVEDIGHSVTGIARTRTDALSMAVADPPELVLADISLADGSSGIDAVQDILDRMTVPVIFITAFPERLLTGERPEPTYLITKPFEPETVTATIGQALLVHREQHALRLKEMAEATPDDAPNPRKQFDTPAALLADPHLNDVEKQALLTDWDADMDGRLNAESEGMSASDPMSANRESRLADEAGRVKSALASIVGKTPAPS